VTEAAPQTALYGFASSPLARRSNQVKAALAGAGHDPTQATVWLMEGLIGYLTRRESFRLVR
jgi:hypothetical protein